MKKMLVNRDSKKNPRISIITVCYNEESEIKDTCESVVGQTYRDYEWIVVDGGSTDKTIEILEKYNKGISKLISEKDSGVYNAMNKGIKMAKGEYLIFLNGGDYFFEKNILKKIFEENDFKEDILYGDCFVFNKNGSKGIVRFNDNIDKFYLLGTCINHQSTFIRRKLFKKFGLYDENYKILADYEKWFCFLKNKVIFQKVPFIVSNFKFFDGLSSQEKTKMLNKKEREIIIKKYFKKEELLKHRISCYFKKVFYDIKSFASTSKKKTQNRIIDFLQRFFESNKRRFRFVIFSPKKFVKKYKDKIAGSSLRQPARKIWYGIRFKKIK